MNATADRENRVDEIIADYLKSVRDGSAPTREKLLAMYPDLAEELSSFFADQDQFDQLAAPLRAAAPPASGWWRRLDFGDYEVLDEVARGGMGVVFRARQRSLNRIVALKMLLAGPLAGPAALQRFRMEAEAVATLDHPNIVPIYEVGACGDQPFFSLKYMEGGTLAGNRQQFSDPRAAARLVATVAGAVHYAHQRAILHRDLKPTNILLDADHRPHVTDFGLAKRVEEPTSAVTFIQEGAPSASVGPFPGWSQLSTHVYATPNQTHTDNAYATQTGMIIGTPSYMAPEQASGDKGSITIAADVYGLGAILYELLTGKPPLRGPTPLETLRLLREAQPERPRTLRPGLDRDLETICLKCLEKDPHQRYSSAEALAEDLQRYLDGEPIRARPTGTIERAWRWCVRKPVIAGLAASLIMTVVAAFAIVSVLGLIAWRKADDARANLRQALKNEETAENNQREAEHQKVEAQKNFEEAERQRTEAQKNLEEARRQQALAEKSFHRAHQAVHDFWVRVSERLSEIPGVLALRKELLEGTLKYYDDFLEQRGDDPKLQLETADTLVSVAQINSLIGSKAKSLDAYEKARDLYARLHKADPKNLDLQIRLARGWHNVGTLQAANGRFGPSLDSHLEAKKLYDEFLGDHPQDAELRGGKANTLHNLAVAHMEAGRSEDAFAACRESIELFEQLMRDYPKNQNFGAAVGSGYNQLGVLYRNQEGRTQDALDAYRKALKICADLADNNPKDVPAQCHLAESYHNVGSALHDLGKKDEGRRAWDEAFAIRKRLQEANPTVTYLKCDLAASLTDLGLAASDKGDTSAAIEYYQKARDLLHKVVRDNPGVPQFQSDLGKNYFNAGVRYSALKLRREARDAYQQARDIQEKLVAASGDHLGYRNELATTLVNLGVVQAQLDQFDDGLATLHHGIELQRVTFERAQQVPAYRHTLHALYGSLAEVERAAGHPDLAVDATLERQKLWPDNHTELFNAGREFTMAARKVGKGRAQLSDNERAERDKYCGLAVAALRQAIAHGFKDVERMRKDPDLELLRGRNDFEKLVQEIGN
jgi:serine/threonine protein kinase/tetratricopeptide (TPR) repeat protein